MLNTFLDDKSSVECYKNVKYAKFQLWKMSIDDTEPVECVISQITDVYASTNFSQNPV